ncbi:MAG: biotin transporter BioY [Planctomycetota bacterium]
MHPTATLYPRPHTLADALVPEEQDYSFGRDAMLVAFGVLLVALTAQFAIPTPSGVPITGQTFGVLLVAAALGLSRGFLAMLAYVGLGTLGLPLFASVGSSASYGYLAGFVIAGAVVGLLAERGWDRGFWRTLAMMTIGTLLIFAAGLAWVATRVPDVETLLAGYLVPFLPGAAIKIALAMAVLPLAWMLVGGAASLSRRA